MIRASSFGLSILLLTASLVGCGGGGGDDTFGSAEGAAGVALTARPTVVDIGDQVEVRIRIVDVTEDGIILKVRYPVELSYITDSSVLYLRGEEEEDGEDRAPDQIIVDGDDTYLIYRITEEESGSNNAATLVFDLRANDTKRGARIAVDPDSDSTTPFDPANPEFSEESEAIVIIEE